MKNFVSYILCCMLLIAMTGSSQTHAAGPATAPATTQADYNPTDQLMVTPALADHTSLKIKLLPDFTELHSGNAAPIYLAASDTPLKRAGKSLDAAAEKDVMKRLWNLDTDIPLEKWPLDEALSILDQYADRFDQFDIAAHYDHADWGHGFRDVGWRADSEYRTRMFRIPRELTFKAKLQIRQSDWKAAERTIQDGLAAARHTNSSGLPYDSVIAQATAHIFLSWCVEDWVSRPNSPNLYWALSALPSPMFPRPPAQYETAMFYFSDPRIAAAMNGKLPPEQWHGFIAELITRFEHLYTSEDESAFNAETATDNLIKTSLPRAKKHLLEWGADPKALESMSADHIVGLYFLQEYDRVFNDVTKSNLLPVKEALRAFDVAWAKANTEEPNLGDNPLIQIEFNPEYVTKFHGGTLPMRTHLREATMPDEFVAMFRTIEAIRDYAARHGGKPPASLDQITDLPIPLEPFTNKPFDYELQGSKAVIRPVRTYYYVGIHELTFHN